jgi:AAA15 family ATPase/GTPase
MEINMLRFHFCSSVEKVIHGQSYEKIRNKFDEFRNLKKLGNTSTLHDYGNGIYVLKTFSPHARIIIEQHDVNGNDVYFIREVLTNRDFDYFGFLYHPRLKSGEWANMNPLPEKDKKNALQKLLSEKNLEVQHKKLPPPEHLISWLDAFSLKIDYDIFETQNWVKYALSNGELDGMRDRDVSLFRILVSQLLLGKKNEKQLIKHEKGIHIYSIALNNVAIIFSEIETEKGPVTILFNGAHLEIQKDHWNNSLKEIKDTPISFENNVDSIARFAYRAYPKWTINNDEQWFAIQKNDEMSNLSLTQEQIIFFKQFQFPYYINGQAGSGKSTMLYYLFANSCFYKANGEILGDIIFLTENKELLKHTQKSVFDLLSNNPEFDGLTIDQRTDTYKNFASFKDFLLDLLPKEDLQHFQEDKYLNFSAFKNLYEDSHLPLHIKNNYSAEESWFTIITYIYGYDSSQKISSQQYETQVFSKSQKIPKDKFEGIEENVLPYYEKLIFEEGYWDKLKIIRYLEENIEINKFYSVVICDEAQDFCRVELRFILRMSEFLQYDLSGISQVPIVFAGDPNQTVNPTGFRQGEMTDMLHSELKTSSFDYRKDESVYTPTFNYRSTQAVVNLANFIQFYRKKHLNVQLVKPQIAKREELAKGNNYNLFFNYSSLEDDGDLRDNLISKIKYKIFIIPVDTHEKDNYVKTSSFLSKIAEAEIKTAVEAKGAEYGQVVLYGFGEYYLKSFGDSLFNSQGREQGDEFKKGYFFNKLYVGITRAQNELIIIDRTDSEVNFWGKLINNGEIQDNQWKVLNNFKDNTLLYNPDSVSHVIPSSVETATENAVKDKLQGIFDNNASRLKVASHQFFAIGKRTEGFECLAIAEKIKGNWKLAAEYFLDSELGKSKLEEAANCYFRGKYFKQLTDKIGKIPKSLQQDLRLIVCKLMLSESITEENINKLNNNRDSFRSLVKDIEWREDFMRKFIHQVTHQKNAKYLRDLVEILEVIVNESEGEYYKLIGEAHFNLHNYERSIEAWNKIDFYDNIQYHQAHIEVAKSKKDFENEAIWLSKLHAFKVIENEKIAIENEIIEIHTRNAQPSSNLHYNLAVYGALLIQQPNNKIESVGLRIEKEAVNNLEIIRDFYENLLKSKRLNPKAAEYTIERWAKTNYKLHGNEKNSSVSWLEALNNKYKGFAKDSNVFFKEFTLSDLKKISEFPEQILWNPPNHFKNVDIINFRRFDKIELENLGQFNLLVGDNNVGKTSLLEALLFTHEKDEFIKNLIFAYIDRTNPKVLIDENKVEKYPIPRNFIDSFLKEKDAETSALQYAFQGERSEWVYKVKKLTLAQLQVLLAVKSGFDFKDYLGFESQNDLSFVELPIILKNILPDECIKSPLIPFGKGFHKSLSKVYSDEIDKKKTERMAFLENMKVFIPKIERIIVDTVSGEISIEEEGLEGASPLHQYGEGAIKLFRILVQLSLQKGKRVLIDEIDAGIHFSRFHMFWSVILKFANNNKTQIFATTHNLECVKYFNQILQQPEFFEYQARSRVITLRELPDGSVKAYTRVFSEFDYELDNNLEIRGGEI